MKRKPGHSSPTCEGGGRCYSLIVMGTVWLSTYRVLGGGVHPIADRWGKSPAWNSFPNPLLLLLPCSRCISYTTAARPKQPGVRMDHCPKHIKWCHHHFSLHPTLPTNRPALLDTWCPPASSPPRWVKHRHAFLLLKLFPLKIKPVHPLHCSWKSDWTPLRFTIYVHSSSLPSSQLFWIGPFHNSSYIIPPAQTRMLQIVAAD